MLHQDIAALTVHLRTVKEMSKVPAHWELMPQIKTLRDTLAPQTVLIGNGDIVSGDDVKDKFEEYGCDGFMVGRGIFANPWMFNRSVSMDEKTIADRIALYRHHIELYYQTWGSERNFANLKKFAKTYISNFSDASALRERLMTAKSIDQLLTILNEYKQ